MDPMVFSSIPELYSEACDAGLWLPPTPGVFMLSRDGAEHTYVGRADDTLLESLPRSVREHPHCRYWAYWVTGSAVEAYELECCWWHAYQPLENEKHPEAPVGSSVSCPVPWCRRHRRWQGNAQLDGG